MNRNLRKIMLAAMAVLMLGAITAQAAQAAVFHSSKSSTLISSTPDGTAKNSHHVFDAAGGLITCGGAEASFTGTTSASTVESITIEANYGPKSNCTFFGQTTIVNMNGCDYVFHANKSVDIASKSGRNCATEPISFEVPSPECKVTVGEQTGLGAVDYTNNAGKTEITLDANVSGITYTAVGSGCIETGTKSNGTYTTGNTWVTGAEHGGAGAMASIWYE